MGHDANGVKGATSLLKLVVVPDAPKKSHIITPNVQLKRFSDGNINPRAVILGLSTQEINTRLSVQQGVIQRPALNSKEIDTAVV